MMFIIIGAIIILILVVNKRLDSRKFIAEARPYFAFMKEDDYEFLLSVKYGKDLDINKLYGARIRNALVAFFAMFIVLLSQMSFTYLIVCLIVAYVIFKIPYTQLQSYYKRNLYNIDLMLPYYLKSLEILIQHYTVPVALRRSIATAPDIFKDGLVKLVERIEAGDSTVEPYMEFAHRYPVRDSMRMMRLLYRLGLGSQEDKQEQLIMFSKTISTLQNKAREQKYKNRLETMERKTMTMLICTGAGIIVLLLVSMMSMINI
ncbi:MAG: hypothetical protein E7165_02190 [Firmicutes bacterium]|nr:hypothetical protein [Bacillota bacterium]